MPEKKGNGIMMPTAIVVVVIGAFFSGQLVLPGQQSNTAQLEARLNTVEIEQTAHKREMVQIIARFRDDVKELNTDIDRMGEKIDQILRKVQNN